MNEGEVLGKREPKGEPRAKQGHDFGGVGMLKKTKREIVEKVREMEKQVDLFGVRGDLVLFLSFGDAKEFLVDGIDESKFVRETRDPIDLILDYLPFAWKKANNCRGLSSVRSVEHMKAWLWLAGQEELSGRLEDVYEFYGKPSLVLVSEFVGFDWEKHDNGIWRNTEEDRNGVDIERVLIEKGIRSPSR